MKTKSTQNKPQNQTSVIFGFSLSYFRMRNNSSFYLLTLFLLKMSMVFLCMNPQTAKGEVHQVHYLVISNALPSFQASDNRKCIEVQEMHRGIHLYQKMNSQVV